MLHVGIGDASVRFPRRRHWSCNMLLRHTFIDKFRFPLTQVSLVFIISDLMNEHTFHPITAGVFLLSSSYCIAIIRREWSGGASAEGTRRKHHSSAGFTAVHTNVQVSSPYCGLMGMGRLAQKTETYGSRLMLTTWSDPHAVNNAAPPPPPTATAAATATVVVYGPFIGLCALSLT